MLGKTKLMGAKPPYHALESFHKTVWEASIVSAIMEKLQVQDLESLGRQLESCAFEGLCHELYEQYFDPKVISEARDTRSRATEKRATEKSGPSGRGSRRNEVSNGEKNKQGNSNRQNVIERDNTWERESDTLQVEGNRNVTLEEGYELRDGEVGNIGLEVGGAGVVERGITDNGEVVVVPEMAGLKEGVYIDGDETVDQVKENATLCMQHLALAELFRMAMRDGDSGVVTYMLDIWTLFFHGTNNSKYAAEFLEETINRRLVWTDLYKEVWLNNCLVNLTGRKRYGAIYTI